MDKELQDVLKQVEKKYGVGLLAPLGEQTHLDIASISTGSIALDSAIGIGGVPYGRITEIYGKDSSGKTSLALSIIRSAQLEGKTAAFIDMEHAFDALYAAKTGVNVEDLLVSQPDYAEQALDIVEILVSSGKVSVIVIDSVAALTPKAELEGEMGDTSIGLQARLMSKTLRKLAGPIQKSNMSVVFLNQERQKIHTMGYGEQSTTSGGVALKYYASVRILLQRIKTITKTNADPIGTIIKATIKKNKVAAPFKVAEFKILFDEGVSRTSDLLDTAIHLGIIKKAGAWISYGEYKWQGDENARHELKNNKILFDELKNKINNIKAGGDNEKC